MKQTAEIQDGLARNGNRKKMDSAELARKLANDRDRDAEMITGIFRNLENPISSGSSGVAEFRLKLHKGDTFQYYRLIDGERYRLPRGVVRHLRQNCYYKQYTQSKNNALGEGVHVGYADGRLRAYEHMQMARKIHRYDFVPLDFMSDDIDLNRSNLVEVTASI